MKHFAWVAHSFRVLATVFHRRELSFPSRFFETPARQEKFVAAECRDQPAERGRYPEGTA